MFINESVIDRIIEENNIKVTNETDHEEIFQILKTIIIESINSINEEQIREIIMEQFRKEAGMF